MAVRPEIFIADLCAGGGGLSIGVHDALERLGFRPSTVVYVEREAYAAATIVARMEEKALAEAPVWDDLTTFDGKPWRGRVHCVIGGTPCQDLSVAGRQEGLDGERSRLFWEFKRVIEEIQPHLIFWENVGGARSALSRVFDAFQQIGYTGAGVALRAADVGATQERERIFVLGRRLADADGVRCNQGHRREQISARHRIADDGNQDMADANRNGLRIERQPKSAGQQRAPRDIADGCGGEAMGDASGEPPQLRGEPGELRCEESEVGRAGNASVGREPGPGSETLFGDAAGQGQQGSENLRRDGGEQQSPAERAGRAVAGRPFLWPPGPDDTERWAHVLSTNPDLSPSQPKLRRVADGLAAGVVAPDLKIDAHWADRLRLLGNGVVPAQARAAFLFLIGAVGVDVDEEAEAVHR